MSVWERQFNSFAASGLEHGMSSELIEKLFKLGPRHANRAMNACLNANVRTPKDLHDPYVQDRLREMRNVGKVTIAALLQVAGVKNALRVCHACGQVVVRK